MRPMRMGPQREEGVTELAETLLQALVPALKEALGQSLEVRLARLEAGEGGWVRFWGGLRVWSCVCVCVCVLCVLHVFFLAGVDGLVGCCSRVWLFVCSQACLPQRLGFCLVSPGS